MTDRSEQIADWWDGGFPGAFTTEGPEEELLRKAFGAVLSAMKPEHFESFMDERPTIVCRPREHGCVFRYYVFAPSDEEPGHVNVIYFDPDFARRGARSLVDTVAHESAHVVLKHHHTPHGTSEFAADCEEEADRLSTSWGFRARYSKSRLAQLRGASKE